MRIDLHAGVPDRTRGVLIDGRYSEMMAPHAESGWTQEFGKLARRLGD